jgi:hypothetical protein
MSAGLRRSQSQYVLAGEVGQPAGIIFGLRFFQDLFGSSSLQDELYPASIN